MNCFAGLVAYRGNDFSGFQIQGREMTVQGELERAFFVILKEKIRVHCSGRTDAGVHATGQVIHFHCQSTIDKFDSFLGSVNALVNHALVLKNISVVDESFHARFSCLAREYEYLIWNEPLRNALLDQRCLWYRRKLNLDRLNEQIQSIQGEHDFCSFTRRDPGQSTTMRYIDMASVDQIYDPVSDSRLVSIRIRANAFLYNMIRIIVGTLLDIHEGKIALDMRQILAQKKRESAGKTVPPVGLYFRKAWYLKKWDHVEWLNTMESYPWMRPESGAPIMDHFL